MAASRNYRIHGEFVAIKSTFGYAFWQGNCTLSEGTDKVVRGSVEPILVRRRDAADLEGWNRSLWEARHEAGYIDDIALTRNEVEKLGRFGAEAFPDIVPAKRYGLGAAPAWAIWPAVSPQTSVLPAVR